MEYAFKQLGFGDAEELRKLLKVFADAFEDQRAYQGAVPTDSYLTALLAKPHFIALIAKSAEDEVVGGLAAYVLDKFEQDRREIYIYDLAVSIEHRRKKIATHLILELKRIAKEKDAYVIYVQADQGDDPAIALYDSLGRKEDVLHFDISVE